MRILDRIFNRGDRLTVKQAAEKLGISIAAVYHKLYRQTIKGKKINGHWQVRVK